MCVFLILVRTGVESKSSSDSASDDDNPGEPLFLTKYIESGDIETVGCAKFFSSKNDCFKHNNLKNLIKLFLLNGV